MDPHLPPVPRVIISLQCARSKGKLYAPLRRTLSDRASREVDSGSGQYRTTCRFRNSYTRDSFSYLHEPELGPGIMEFGRGTALDMQAVAPRFKGRLIAIYLNPLQSEKA